MSKAKTRLQQLRNMSPEELAKEERELRDEIWKLELQQSMGQLQDVTRVVKARRDLARLLTVRRERELGLVRNPAARE
jgi:large subunit ribosomal protein L29